MKHNYDEMRALYEQWHQSGLSRKAFCKERGIIYQTFSYWCKRMVEEPSSGFAEISLETEQPVSCELSFPGGIRLSFHRLPPTVWLKELVS